MRKDNAKTRSWGPCTPLIPRRSETSLRMIQGDVVRLHKNTFVRVEGHEGLCIVTGYDSSEHKWRLFWPAQNKELRVGSAMMQLSFCVLPASCSRLGCYHQFGYESAQGACGRGLIAATDIKRGQPIFEEPPLFVVRSCDGSSPLEHHSERWAAYKFLATRAAKDSSDGPWRKALRGFEELVASQPSNRAKDRARLEAAQHIAAQEGSSAPGKSVDKKFLARVLGVLDRFASNEYGLENGNPGDPSWEASGLHVFTSRVNHCCAPTTTVCTKEVFFQANNLPYDLERDGGVVVFVAVRDIKKGERLTASYSESIFVQSMKTARPETFDGNEHLNSQHADPGLLARLASVQGRREHMLERFGFVCACERCTEEEGEERKKGSGKQQPLQQELVPSVRQGEAVPAMLSEHDQGKLGIGIPTGASLAQALHRASADAAVRSPGINLTPNTTPSMRSPGINLTPNTTPSMRSPGINLTPDAAASTLTPASTLTLASTLARPSTLAPVVKTALVGTAPPGTAAPTAAAAATATATATATTSATATASASASATAIATTNDIGSCMTSVLHARAVLLAIGCIAMAVILARARAAREA